MDQLVPSQVISLETNHAGEVFPGSQREVREYLEERGYVLAATVSESTMINIFLSGQFFHLILSYQRHVIDASS